ncbi:MAG: hypothetical protein J6Q13_00305 [Clostridia bacterium]|nr:hypothetical protein [Clostridia bacterium]
MKYEVKSVLFLGVGGISMHQLAIAMKNMGVKVFGYDLHSSKYTKLCEQQGIKVVHKFDKEICSVDLCVKTGAVKDGKFFDYLNKKNVPILDRAEILAWLCSKFKTVIAVAGTHGKSTTATLIYHILKESGKKVSCHIGADVKNSRFKIGDEILVVEACEYNKSFLKLKPTISVVTNVEKEHMDSYGNLFNLKSAFLTFLKRGEKRFVFVEKSTKFLKKYSNINFVENLNLEINPQIKGEHNLKNISLAMAVCEDLGVNEKTIIKAVNSFEGVPRRYELIGNYENSKVYIDYAHHPTEVKAFIETFQKENINSQIIFQPHTYSRTKTFLKEFVSIFSNVENLIIFKEYSAREKPEQGLSAKDLYLKIKKVNPNVQYCESGKALLKKLETNSALAFVGAGDINLIAEAIVKQKNK